MACLMSYKETELVKWIHSVESTKTNMDMVQQLPSLVDQTYRRLLNHCMVLHVFFHEIHSHAQWWISLHESPITLFKDEMKLSHVAVKLHSMWSLTSWMSYCNTFEQSITKMYKWHIQSCPLLPPSPLIATSNSFVTAKINLKVEMNRFTT